MTRLLAQDQSKRCCLNCKRFMECPTVARMKLEQGEDNFYPTAIVCGVFTKRQEVKYHQVRTFSKLCDRWFDSGAEAAYGEVLRLRELAGDIEQLEYQVRYELCDKPKVWIVPDFRYVEQGKIHVEDVKGMVTDAARVKMAWLKAAQGIEVKIIKKER